MLTRKLIKIWFAHLTSHMDGFQRGAVLGTDHNNQQAGETIVQSDDFLINDRTQQVADAVIRRLKAIVQKIQYAEPAVANQANSTVQIVSDIEHNDYLICCPIIFERRVGAVLCLELRHSRQDGKVDLLAEVESYLQWLYSMASIDMLSTYQDGNYERSNHAMLAVELSSFAVSHDNSVAAATAMLSRLASFMECERVTLGYLQDSVITTYAQSNSAQFESRQNLIKRIEAAMHEAIDQKDSIAYPKPDDVYYAVQAHRELSEHDHNSRVCTIPVVYNGKISGCACFERSSTLPPFSHEAIELCEHLITLVAPVIDYRRRDEFSLIDKLKDSASRKLQEDWYKGKAKAAALFMAGLMAITMALIEIDYRIPADAVLEGAIERVVTAPESGFIKQAGVRPGDIIKQDDTMATLDDRDLQLEKNKWSGKILQVSREFREALAGTDRSKIGILRAQLDQAEAQLAILDKKLQRTRITSPLDGVIVSGDYTHSLGSPIDKGQVMYRLSPLDDYRIVMQVDESDIAALSTGMQGELTLNAAVQDSYTFTVEKITPVSTSSDNANTFQVEGILDSEESFMRPGMQGIARINAGKRSIVWIWTHDFVEWIMLKTWSWI